MESDVFFDEGVGPDNDLRGARGDLGKQRLFFLLFLPASGKEPHGDAEGPGQGSDVPIMLFREDLRGRHDAGLVSVLHGKERRNKGHHGLAAPHVALDEAVHGTFRCHVLLDLVDDPLLGRGQRIGQALPERRFKLPSGGKGYSFFLDGHALFPECEAQFQGKELLEAQPAVCGARPAVQDVDVLFLGGKVDLRQGVGCGHEGIFFDQMVGKGFRNRRNAGIDDAFHHCPEIAYRESRCSTIDGHGPAGMDQEAVQLAFVHELIFGVVHLRQAALVGIGLHYAGKDDLLARPERLFHERLVKPGADEDAALVRDNKLEDLDPLPFGRNDLRGHHLA